MGIWGIIGCVVFVGVSGGWYLFKSDEWDSEPLKVIKALGMGAFVCVLLVTEGKG